MRILVTGCNGQVGRHLVQKLQGSVELVALDKDALNIADEHAVNLVVKRIRPDFIINAAAYTAVDKAEDEVELAYAINCSGVKNLAQAANSYGATIIHISTDYVFSGSAGKPYLETDATGPLNIYGKSKLAGEQAIISETTNYIILRTAWVFSEYGNNFVKTMLRVGKEKTVLSIVNDQFGGPTYAGDIAHALITIMHKVAEKNNAHLYGVYHYSGYPHVSWYAFAQAIFTEADKQRILNAPELKGIASEEYLTPAPRPCNSRLATDKIYECFGIMPSDWGRELMRISEYVK